ncbi:aminotransferase class I/II-fold pyridoxal phosphate-dependent enzyme [Parafannyhessea umbonata]|uniref:aminotransferase class I/II-fold pyridoxal phosphate-dependent enzyme n=1 Tax=Parafannyhessea umbonata TaxID=604330 RepID=UPI003AF3CC36
MGRGVLREHHRVLQLVEVALARGRARGLRVGAWHRAPRGARVRCDPGCAARDRDGHEQPVQPRVGEVRGPSGPVEEYARKRDLLYGGLTDIGYDVVHPDGAFYLWVRALEPDDDAFQARAANEQRLYVVGSRDFACRSYFRLSYCVSDECIKTSLPAFRRLFESYGGYVW